MADDHGTNLTTATTVTVGSITPGTTEATSDRDYFKFTVTTSGFHVVYSRGDGRYQGKLYDAAFQAITATFNQNAEGNNVRIEEVLNAGDYYLELIPVSYTGPYDVHIEGPGAGTESDDHGYSPWSATEAGPGSITHGEIDVGGDLDYFKFTVTTAGTHVIFTRGAGRFEGKLFNAICESVSATYNQNGEAYNVRIEEELSPGDYYLKLMPVGYLGAYDVHIEGPGAGTESDDHGYSPWSATGVDPGTYVDGVIQVDGDLDFFTFTVPTAGTYAVYTRGSGRFQGKLFDAAYASVSPTYNQNDAGYNVRIEQDLAPGVYYFKLMPVVYTGAYQVHVELAGAVQDDGRRFGQPPDVGFAKDPVNTCDGNFAHTETDLFIASVGPPLEWVRSYNSRDAYSGPLGVGWTHTYNIRVIAETGTLVAVKWADGRMDRHANPTGGVYAAVYPECRDTLCQESNLTWTLRRRDLGVLRFDALGRLASLADRNSNALAFAYDGLGRLATVADATGRQLALAYTNDRVASVSGPAGRTVRFLYSGTRLSAALDFAGRAIAYGYDGGGRLDSITDRRGVRTVLNVYDAAGRVVEQRDGNSNVTWFAYDTPAPGRTRITDALGHATVHTHSNGLLTAIAFPNGGTVEYAYDGARNRSGIRDRNGGRVEFAHDAHGNVVQTTAPDGGITGHVFGDPRFPSLPTRRVDPVGTATEWAYDARGNVVEERRAVGTALQCARGWAYNAGGQVTAFTNELGHVTRYGYETNAGPYRGALRWIEDAQGRRTWYAPDELWRTIAITDPRGAAEGDPACTVQFGYDGFDRMIWKTTPIGTVRWAYDAAGHLATNVDARGNVRAYERDANGNLRYLREPLGRTTEYRYDALDRRLCAIDPNGRVTSNAYDNMGNLAASVRYMAPEPSNLVVRYAYDLHGNVVSEVDASGRTLWRAYDASHRRVAQSNEMGHVWRWEYDLGGRVTNAVDANGAATVHRFDLLGRLAEVTRVDDLGTPLTARFEHDAAGNPIRGVDAGGRSVEREYDGMGRIVVQRDGHGNAFRFAYDAAGNRTNAVDANGRGVALAYDAENRLVGIRYPRDAPVAFQYDVNGNRVAMEDATGTTRFHYDALDRLVASTNAHGDAVGYAYDLAGNRTGLDHAGERLFTYAYDGANRLRSMTDWSNRVTTYRYDGDGRGTEVVYPNGVACARLYDAAGRLSAMDYDHGGSNLLRYAFARDGVGNPIRIDQEGLPEPRFDLPADVLFTNDVDHRLTGSTEGLCFYDGNGNMTGLVHHGAATAFVYDDSDRLVWCQRQTNSVGHIYDGQGWRVAQVENGVTNRYVLDYGGNMSQVLAVLDSDGRCLRRWMHGPMIIGADDAGVGEQYWLHDEMGNCVAVCDAQGHATGRSVYAPFGESVSTSGAMPGSFAFAGGLGVSRDACGALFMRSRFYMPELGRFGAKDPLGLTGPVGSQSPYGYAMNMPLAYADPDGNFAIGARALGAAVGGLVSLTVWGGMEIGREVSAVALYKMKVISSEELCRRVMSNEEFKQRSIEEYAQGALLGAAFNPINVGWKTGGYYALKGGAVGFKGGQYVALEEVFLQSVLIDGFKEAGISALDEILLEPVREDSLEAIDWLIKHPRETREALDRFWWGRHVDEGMLPHLRTVFRNLNLNNAALAGDLISRRL